MPTEDATKIIIKKRKKKKKKEEFSVKSILSCQQYFHRKNRCTRSNTPQNRIKRMPTMSSYQQGGVKIGVLVPRTY